jgi:nitroreductase
MDTLKIDNLFARRSIRAFTAEPVTPAQVETLLAAAMAAPSASNRKPWHFVAVTDAGVRAKLAAVHPDAQMVLQSPLAIVPCGDPALSIPDRQDYWIQDLAAATENILLAAVGMGLGAVWCGVHPVPERVRSVRKVLGIPEGVIPFALIPVGYPAESKEPRTQYEAGRVHRERW